jgi:hypothetical protein
MTLTAELAAPAVRFPALTLNDRCDRCGAEALVRLEVLVASEPMDLVMCAHHARHFEPGLAASGVRVVERKEINIKPSPAAY